MAEEEKKETVGEEPAAAETVTTEAAEAAEPKKPRAPRKPKEDAAEGADAKPDKPKTEKAPPKAKTAEGEKTEKPAEKTAAGKKEEAPPPQKITPRLKTRYQNEAAPALMKKFEYKSPMQIPRFDKIVVNVGCGDARDNPKILESVVSEITQITGQKAVVTHARKSVANFKVREGMPVGVKVTLRASRMWEFLDRLLNVVLPRVRDFRGINPNAFDGRGNYALGLREQSIFPEIDYDKIDKIRGMDIVICTTAETDEEARELLVQMGAPFARS